MDCVKIANSEKKRNRSYNWVDSLTKSPKKPNNNKSVCLFSSSDSLDSLSINSFEKFQLDHQNMSGLKKLNSTITEDIEMQDPQSEGQNNNVAEILSQLDSVTSPRPEDLMAGITATLRTLVSVQQDIKNTNTRLTGLSSKIEQNTENIQINNDNINYNHNLILKNIENVNFLKQLQIDNNVLINGFSGRPNEELATEKILETFEIPINTVQSTNSFESKGTAKKPKTGMLFIKFKTKEDHINFLKKKETVGPIFQSQLLPSSSENGKDSQLTISRCLTTENRDVINQLRAIHGLGGIKSIRYRNCCFQMQIKENDPFIPVPSTEHLKCYFDFNAINEMQKKQREEQQQKKQHENQQQNTQH